MKWWWWILPFFWTTSVASFPSCPAWMNTNGYIHELGILADAVSWGESDNLIWGICGNYYLTQDIHGKYDTHLRIYQSESFNFTVLSFGPTQLTPEGQSIHKNREMTHCTFLPSCQGKVHNHFQEAFQSIVEQIDDWSFLHYQTATVGHSVGGSLQLFMGIYLWQVYGKAPILSLGFAGAFIGDALFAHTYLSPYLLATNYRWWQIETMDVDNPNNYDGTVEFYQVGKDELYILTEAICMFVIHPLCVPHQAYGMHDMKQYQLFINGQDC